MKQSTVWKIILACALTATWGLSALANPVQQILDVRANELITELSLRDQGITSLDGIEALANLRTLDLRGNPIQDLEPLRNLIHLESLNLRDTLVTDLSPIAGLVNLEYLNIHSTNVANPEVIANFKQLETLIMRNVHLGDNVGFMAELTNLARLNARNTGITDVSAIAALLEQGALREELDLRDNPLRVSPEYDAYAPLRPHWDNIAAREPINLPDVPQQTIYINEVMTSNGSFARDRDGDYPDWIELYNPNGFRVDISGYYLSDDMSAPDAWRLPDGTSISARSHLVIYASGKDARLPGGEIHANFRLSGAGEPILLSDPQGRLVDYFAPIAIPRDVSYGRYPDGGSELLFFTRPTPGRQNSNADAYTGVAQPPQFSRGPGFYADDFHLELRHPDPEVTIYYTLDGSEPNSKSSVYTKPILISKDPQKPMLLSHVPVLGAVDPNLVETDHVGQLLFKGYNEWHPQDIFQATVVRAVAYRDGEIASEIVTHTYFVDPDMPSRYSFPIISLVTDPDHLMDYNTGIYVPGARYRVTRPGRPWHNPANYTQRGIQWERPVSVEYFEPDGSLGFSIDMGMRINGGVTRSFPQKSLRLYARSQYDSQDAINYPVFPGLSKKATGEPLQEFRRLLLRNSGNDWTQTLFADALMQRLVAHRSLDTQAYRPAITFINGEYWGILNIRERYDQHYIAAHYGLDPDDVVILDGPSQALYQGRRGDERHFVDMVRFAQTADMSQQENYDYIQTLMDVDNFIDYYVAQIYYGNTDGPSGNVKYWRARTDAYMPDAPYGHDGRWRWLLFDTDFGFGYAHGEQSAWHDTVQHALERNGQLLRGLLRNDDFKNKFLNTFADHLNTTYEPQRVIALIDEMEAALMPEIEEHIRRWGQPATTVEGWRATVNRLRDYALRRPEGIRQILAAHFNLRGIYRLTVNNPSLGGHITVNSIVLDPSTPGVTDPSSWSGDYFLNVPLELRAEPKPGYRFVRWEGNATSSSPTIRISPGTNFHITAVFEAL